MHPGKKPGHYSRKKSRFSQKAKESMLLDPNTKGGLSRRKILRFLLEHKRANIYQLANSVYGDGVRYFQSARHHVRILEKAPIHAVKYEDGLVTLTSRCKNLCREHGIATVEKVENLLQSLLLTSPELMRTELSKIYEIVTEEVIKTCTDILNSDTSPDEQISNIDAFGLVLAIKYYQTEREFIKSLETREQDPDDPNYPVLKPFYEEYEQKYMIAYPLVKKRNQTKQFDLLQEWINELAKKITLIRKIARIGGPKNILMWQRFWSQNLLRIIKAYDEADRISASTV